MQSSKVVAHNEITCCLSLYNNAMLITKLKTIINSIINKLVLILYDYKMFSKISNHSQILMVFGTYVSIAENVITFFVFIYNFFTNI